MATLPPETILSPIQAAGSAVAPGGTGADAAILADWARLHQQAERIALLARIGAEPAQRSDAFAALIAPAKPWQRMLVTHAIDDAAAMLDSGLAALATLSARGQDTAAPALALWREFHAARAGMLAVLEAAEPA
jgi:hypothetical protein